MSTRPDAGDSFHLEGGIPVLNTQLERIEVEQAEAKRRDEQYRDEQVSIQRRTLYTQIALVAFGLIGAGISGYAAHSARVSADAARDAVSVAGNTLAETKLSNARQAKLAQDAFDASREQFRKDQRPYIGQTSKSSEGPKFYENPKDPSSGQVTWTWHMTNYGKTPANNVTFTQEMQFAGRSFVSTYGAKGPSSTGPPLPPGDDVFDTVISEPATKTDVDKLLKVTGGVAIRIKIHYTDAEGAEYETSICLSRLNSGAISYCKKDNYMK